MVDFELLKKLRSETGVSFSLCKKALEESKNDLKAAKIKLQEWGAKKASEKAERETSQGGIFSYVHHNRKIAAMILLMSETDFVSANDEFKGLGQEIAMQLASVPAESVTELMSQPYIRDPGKTIETLIKEAVLKFGENIKVQKMLRWEMGA